MKLCINCEHAVKEGGVWMCHRKVVVSPVDGRTLFCDRECASERIDTHGYSCGRAGVHWKEKQKGGAQ